MTRQAMTVHWGIYSVGILSFHLFVFLFSPLTSAFGLYQKNLRSR